jgi:hypothetical protein
MNGNLSTVAQAVLDSCSTTRQPLGKNSSVNKLLYRAEVDRWRNSVANHYTAVETAPVAEIVKRRGALKSNITPVEANAVLLLLGCVLYVVCLSVVCCLPACCVV